MTTILEIRGMHCDSCKTLIEDVCKDISGVHSCAVDVQNGLAVIQHDAAVDVQTIVAEIAALGEYAVSVKQ